MADGGCDAQVAVVGAGPVGMTAALALGRRGVSTVVLEAADGPTEEGSKAICIQADVLDTFARLGCAEPMVKKGVSWTLGRTYYRDLELFQIRFAQVGRGAFPPFINLGQFDTEACLLEALDACEPVRMRWSHPVIGLQQDADGVSVQVDASDGSTTLRVRYVVGCDGPRSTVRELMGIGFPGHSHPDRFLIADIRTHLPGAVGSDYERRFFFDPPFNPGRQVLVHPQPDGVWRIDWQVPPDTDVDEERRTGRLDARIREVVGDAGYELVWLSSYRFHQRAAERFRVGRVLLAGDAAHVMSPFGARGMNSGCHDAENLAWKLALVLKGRAPAALLDSYDAERRDAARANLGVTDATMRFMAPPSPLRWRLRNVVLRGSVRLRPLRRLVNSGRLYQPHTYRRSPIVDRHAPAADRVRARALPEPGALAPDAPVRVAGRSDVARLRQLVADGFVALALPSTPDRAEGVGAALAAPSTPVPCTVAVVAPPGRHPAPVLPSTVVAVSDPEGVLRATYAPRGEWLYLLRPDGHIAVRRRGLDDVDLAAALRRACAVG